MKKLKKLSFIDLFAGCGGLSLGLLNAGCSGVFAIEKNPDAFRTLKRNLIENFEHNSLRPKFDWPKWLDQKPFELKAFVRKNQDHIKNLRGKINLVVGGPPCQGFSYAGLRKSIDPRNELFKIYTKFVSLVLPDFVLIENVPGFKSVIGGNSLKKSGPVPGRPRQSYAEKLYYRLKKINYVVQQRELKSVNFGVPQLRPRFFTLGVRDDIFKKIGSFNFEKELFELRGSFLKSKNLPLNKPISVYDAISDLETENSELIECTDIESPDGFKEIRYKNPLTPYQRLMHWNMNGLSPNSLRLVNHKPSTIKKYKQIQKTCRPGVNLTTGDRLRLGIKKNSITPLDRSKPCSTITTLPDDLLHYEEPRIHTVRENARIQSFPDWFEFRGNFTTGGKRRKIECPRYTQVGNAVPPLLAEILGLYLINKLNNI